MAAGKGWEWFGLGPVLWDREKAGLPQAERGQGKKRKGPSPWGIGGLFHFIGKFDSGVWNTAFRPLHLVGLKANILPTFLAL
jgi:hypothetical protein